MLLKTARLTNCVGDILLTAQLLTFLFNWLQHRPRRHLRTYRAAYWLYALNLTLAACFTICGAYLHIKDPLPQEPTVIWIVFLLSCVSTPIIFPVISVCAIFPGMSWTMGVTCVGWLIASSSLHGWLALSDVDLAAALPMPVVTLGGRMLDGRSIGGEPFGISFDLMSSIPCSRGACLFPHVTLFTLAVAGVLGILVTFLRDECACAKWSRKSLHLAQRLALSVGIMLLGQIVMTPFLAVVGVARALDIWHASMFVVMALAFTALRGLLCEEGRTTAPCE